MLLGVYVASVPPIFNFLIGCSSLHLRHVCMFGECEFSIFWFFDFSMWIFDFLISFPSTWDICVCMRMWRMPMCVTGKFYDKSTRQFVSTATFVMYRPPLICFAAKRVNCRWLPNYNDSACIFLGKVSNFVPFIIPRLHFQDKSEERLRCLVFVKI